MAQAAAADSVHRSVSDAHKLTMKELQKYRLDAQGKERARDWDLSRPDRLRNERPARREELHAAAG